ncbi:MAG: Hsp20/alpha crystallin family protein [Acidobacteria bacterium]|nr:MAG: Hsp20/alpha crystallin family protein [Acidobacteriota bacterium]
MKMMRWDPFRELETLSSRLNQYLGPPAVTDEEAAFGEWAPAMDIEETPTEYVMRADLPDVKKEEVKVGVDNGVLSLEGERKQEKTENTRKFHRVERVYGKFVRRIAVPTDVDQQKILADFKNGVLTVHLPKSASATPRSIDVKVA